MSHEVETMMFVGQEPWHSLGKKVDKEIDIKRAIIESGLNWNASKVQLVTEDSHVKVDRYAVRRDSDSSILGTVGSKYHILQNIDAFDWFQPFLDSGLVQLDTAGSLFCGQKVWVLAKTKAVTDIVKNDPVEQYVLLSNSHDGSSAVRVGFSGIRVVCRNTLSKAIGDKASKLIRIRHGAEVKDNLNNVRDIMNVANAEFEATAEQFKKLAHKQINQKDIEKYVRTVLKVKPDADTGLEIPFSDLPTKTQNRMNEIFELIEGGRGTDIKGVRGTAWGLYNAITEQLSWNACRNKESRFDSLWFGANAGVNKLALETALSLGA